MPRNMHIMYKHAAWAENSHCPEIAILHDECNWNIYLMHFNIGDALNSWDPGLNTQYYKINNQTKIFSKSNLVMCQIEVEQSQC